MYSLDIETLSTESTAVILSIGMTYVPDSNPRSYQDIVDAGIFIKLDARDQIFNYGRIVSKDTLEWWGKQSDEARDRNLSKKATDIPAKEALELLNSWVHSVGNPKEDICWIRGTLDQVCIDSLCNAVGVEKPFMYNRYRDVRTAIDILYPETSKNGYVEIDPNRCIGYDRSMVLKHHSLHDASMDIAMLMFGVNE